MTSVLQHEIVGRFEMFLKNVGGGGCWSRRERGAVRGLQSGDVSIGVLHKRISEAPGITANDLRPLSISRPHPRPPI